MQNIIHTERRSQPVRAEAAQPVRAEPIQPARVAPAQPVRAEPPQPVRAEVSKPARKPGEPFDTSGRTGNGRAPSFRTHGPPRRRIPTSLRPRTPAPPGHQGDQSAGFTQDMATALKEFQKWQSK